MFCHKCGTEIADGAGFCHKCGTKVESMKTTHVVDTESDPATAAEPDISQNVANNQHDTNPTHPFVRFLIKVGGIAPVVIAILALISNWTGMSINPALVIIGLSLFVIGGILKFIEWIRSKSISSDKK